MHFTTTTFCWSISKMTKFCCFAKTAHISQRFERCLDRQSIYWWLWKESVCWGWDEKQTWRWTKLLQILGLTTIGSHSHVCLSVCPSVRPSVSPALDEPWSLPPPCWCVLVATLPRWSSGRLSTHQSFVVVGFGWSFSWYFFQHGAPDMIVQLVQIWRILTHYSSAANL